MKAENILMGKVSKFTSHHIQTREWNKGESGGEVRRQKPCGGHVQADVGAGGEAGSSSPDAHTSFSRRLQGPSSGRGADRGASWCPWTSWGKMRQLAKSLQWDLSYYIESKQIRTPANYSLEKTKSNVHDSLEQHLHSHACKHCMLISVRLYHIYTGG